MSFLKKGSNITNITGGGRWGKVYYVPLTYPLYKSTLGNKMNLVLEGAVGENHATKPAFYEAKLRFVEIFSPSEPKIMLIIELNLYLIPKIFKMCISEML